MKKLFILLSILIVSSCNITITMHGEDESEEINSPPDEEITSQEIQEKSEYITALLGKILMDCAEQGVKIKNGTYICKPEGTLEDSITAIKSKDGRLLLHTDRIVLNPDMCSDKDGQIKLLIENFEARIIEMTDTKLQAEAYFEDIYVSSIGREIEFGKFYFIFDKDSKKLELAYDLEGKNSDSYRGDSEDFMAQICDAPIPEEENNLL